MFTRRHFIETVGASAAALGSGTAWSTSAGAEPASPHLEPALPEGVRNSARLESLPGKKPLIKLAYRPPNYETPIEHFRTAITPNDAFFVRYRLSNIPQVDAATWKLAVG